MSQKIPYVGNKSITWCNYWGISPQNVHNFYFSNAARTNLKCCHLTKLFILSICLLRNSVYGAVFVHKCESPVLPLWNKTYGCESLPLYNKKNICENDGFSEWILFQVWNLHYLLIILLLWNKMYDCKIGFTNNRN